MVIESPVLSVAPEQIMSLSSADVMPARKILSAEFGEMLNPVPVDSAPEPTKNVYRTPATVAGSVNV